MPFFCFCFCIFVLFFIVLVTKCGYYSISDYEYRHFVKLSDIKNSQPDGYILRIIIYIQGARDGNILLATSDHPNYERDFVYEIGKYWQSFLFFLNSVFQFIFFHCFFFSSWTGENSNKLFLFVFFCVQ